MKKFFILVSLLIIFTNLYSQTSNLNFLIGEWKWTDANGAIEFIIKLRKTQYTLSSYFGGGTKECVVGTYVYKKNGQILIDNSEEQNQNDEPIQFPIWIDAELGLGVRDYLTINNKGQKKYLSGFSKIEIVSENSPKQIRWIINDNREQLIVTIDSDDGEDYFFPEGTSLPTNIILTKVE